MRRYSFAHAIPRYRTPTIMSCTSQLVKPGSTLAKTKALATERDLFFWGGLSSAGSVAGLSALSLIFGQRQVHHVLHLIMGLSTALAVSLGVLRIATGRCTLTKRHTNRVLQYHHIYLSSSSSRRAERSVIHSLLTRVQ